MPAVAYNILGLLVLGTVLIVIARVLCSSDTVKLLINAGSITDAQTVRT